MIQKFRLAFTEKSLPERFWLKQLFCRCIIMYESFDYGERKNLLCRMLSCRVRISGVTFLEQNV